MGRAARLDASEAARPFVKWAGGKRQLAEAIATLVPKLRHGATYHEPFVGGGAIFFHLREAGLLPGPAVLSDVNAHLVTTWSVVRDRPSELSRRVAELGRAHDESRYYAERERYNVETLDDLERAALLIYLNRTGFNGLYRVNASGNFNVPFGRQPGGPAIPDEAHLRACSEALVGAEVLLSPFESVLDRARSGDLVYLDPPYVPLSATAFFTAYGKDGFGPEDQERLRGVFAELDRRGCHLLLSNSGTPRVRELYAAWTVREVSARRSINSKTTARGPVPEVIVTNSR